jgi:hypothetical protein
MKTLRSRLHFELWYIYDAFVLSTHFPGRIMKSLFILVLAFSGTMASAEVFDFNGVRYNCTPESRAKYRCAHRCAVYASNDANSCFRAAADFCGYNARCTRGPCEVYASNDPSYCVQRGADVCTSDD